MFVYERPPPPPPPPPEMSLISKYNYHLYTRNSERGGFSKIFPEVIKYHHEGEYFAESSEWRVYKLY